jgi:tRNA pseudouridine38-40 synthase
MSRRKILLIVAYDGTDFNGWQIQSAGRTVQGVMESGLSRMHGHHVRIQAAGRTDSGVHADGQCVTLYTDIDTVPADRFAVAANSYFPRDVKAVESREVPSSFHARYSALAREYRYYLLPSPVPLPHHRRYSLQLRTTPEVGALNRMAGLLCGTHDFATFAAARDTAPDTVRTIYSAAFFHQGPLLLFRVRANGFLWKMVRSIIGTMLHCKGDVEDFRRRFHSAQREEAGPTAPAVGLFLHRVEYDMNGV